MEAALAILHPHEGGWRFAAVSAGLLRALELSRSEIDGLEATEVLAREAALPLSQAAKRVSATGRVSMDIPIRMPDRRIRHARVSLSSMTDGAVMLEMSPGPRPEGIGGETELSAAVMQAELDERRRIAREVHDAMAQHLVVIDLTLSRIQREAGDALPPNAVEEIKDALRAAHSEVRTFSYLLHPPDLERFGLTTAVEKFATGFAARTGLIMTLAIEDLPALDAVSSLTLFRVAQEALMNVHRHARAAHVDIRLHIVAGEVELEVADDGVGASPEHLEHVLTHGAAGVGISGMKARLEQLDGRLRLEVLPRGLRLRATLPVRPG